MRSARDGHASLTYLVAAHFGKLFPLKLHPNVLVLAGVVLALVAHMVMAVTCPYMRYTDRSVRPSRWVTLMAGVLLWLGRVRLDGSIWCAMLFAVEGMQRVARSGAEQAQMLSACSWQHGRSMRTTDAPIRAHLRRICDALLEYLTAMHYCVLLQVRVTAKGVQRRRM